MSKRIEEFKRNIKGKKVAVIGAGVSNTQLIKFLSQCDVKITVYDKKEGNELGDIYTTLKNFGCNFSLGQGYLDDLVGSDYIFRTPAMRYDLPQLQKAQQNGAVLTSETELLFELCPCQIFGITGSDGKTTTTTLIYLILQEAGFKCWLGGNIGIPLIDKVEEMSEDDKVIVELSSFQLHTFKKSPNVSIITNVAPNHLDYHTDMDEYIDAKRNIFRHQSSKDLLILNYDNQITKELAQQAKGKVSFFSRISDIDQGLMLKDNAIIKRQNGIDSVIINASDIALPGVHNIENYLAAIAATNEYASIENIKKVANTFKGVEHRIEPVRELNDVKFYNDSVASSPSRTTATLNSFKQKVILIAGGYDKKIPYDGLGKTIIDKCKSAFLIGKTADKIEKDIRNFDSSFAIQRCNSLEEAISKAYESSEKGDVIILSPASASFDMFKSFEERGKLFKQIVNNLK